MATAKEIKKISGLKIEASQKIPNIITTRTLLVGEYFGKKCNIRIFPTARYRQAYKNELSVLSELGKSRINLQPEVYFHDNRLQLLIVSYIIGKTGGKLFRFNSEFIKSIQPETVGKHFIVLKTVKTNLPNESEILIDFFKTKLTVMEKFLGGSEEKLVRHFRKILAEIIKPDIISSATLSHGDINPGNFIYQNNDFKLIDWELAKKDSFYRDFACIYYLSLNYQNWSEKFLEYLKNNIKNFNLKIFYSYVFFSLLGDASTFKKMKAENNYQHYRSGKMKKADVEDFLNHNIKIANGLINKNLV